MSMSQLIIEHNFEFMICSFIKRTEIKSNLFKSSVNLFVSGHIHIKLSKFASQWRVETRTTKRTYTIHLKKKKTHTQLFSEYVLKLSKFLATNGK